MKQLALTLLISLAQSITIVKYLDGSSNFEDQTPDQILSTSDISITGLTATPFEFDDGTGNEYYVQGRGPETDARDTETTYLAFTVSNSSTGVIDELTSLNFDLLAYTGSPTSVHRVYFRALVSVDGGAFELLSSGNLGVAPEDVFQSTSRSINLSGLDLGSSYEFRIALSDNTGATNKFGLVNNIKLEGTVTSVPEPSGLILLGLSSIAFLSLRKRQ